MNAELTPEEHAALRARIVGGARGIKPAGAHRGAVIAGAIAAVLVIAVAGGVAATSTLSAPQIATTPSPTATVTAVETPTPTSTPVSTATPPAVPVVAFGGDCDQMMTDAEASDFLRGGGAARYASSQLEADTSGSLALLGGISCTWANEGDGFTVVVGAPDAIAPELAASISSTRCVRNGGCSLGQTTGDLWIAVQDHTSPADVSVGFTADEIATAAVRLERVISFIGRKAHAAPVATIDSVLPTRWTLTDCETLQGRIETITGGPVTSYTPRDDDLQPTELVDRVLTSSAGMTACSYRQGAQDSRGHIIVTLMPGASAPSSSVLDLPDVDETDVAGADKAWIQVPYDHVYMLGLVATVGDDRLVLSRMTVDTAVTDAQQIAAAVIDVVRGGD
ncbi:hypothetical protein [Microbacterium trichothecenolyticum]|uniref:PknH-like protein n=1 Tax=Microbacterium trichothecenolyticum TaxID=69370 RepID=A0ABU0TSY4_MICTR|nr:hypothetical protein [Microbacterium trichothecenolyticum]MDQ1122784.1 hypothetical protein [Microbacterium trichothecenolyticum]